MSSYIPTISLATGSTALTASALSLYLCFTLKGLVSSLEDEVADLSNDPLLNAVSTGSSSVLDAKVKQLLNAVSDMETVNKTKFDTLTDIVKTASTTVSAFGPVVSALSQKYDLLSQTFTMDVVNSKIKTAIDSYMMKVNAENASQSPPDIQDVYKDLSNLSDTVSLIQSDVHELLSLKNVQQLISAINTNISINVQSITETKNSLTSFVTEHADVHDRLKILETKDNISFTKAVIGSTGSMTSTKTGVPGSIDISGSSDLWSGYSIDSRRSFVSLATNSGQYWDPKVHNAWGLMDTQVGFMAVHLDSDNTSLGLTEGLNLCHKGIPKIQTRSTGAKICGNLDLNGILKCDAISDTAGNRSYMNINTLNNNKYTGYGINDKCLFAANTDGSSSGIYSNADAAWSLLVDSVGGTSLKMKDGCFLQYRRNDGKVRLSTTFDSEVLSAGLACKDIYCQDDLTVNGKASASTFTNGNILWYENYIASSGRLHMYSNHGTSTSEVLYLDHNKGGAVIGKEFGGSGNLTVQGDFNLTGNAAIAGVVTLGNTTFANAPVSANGYKSGMVTWSDNYIGSSGRLHMYSNSGTSTSEVLYLDHNKGGAVIGKEFGGSGNLIVQGDLAVTGNSTFSTAPTSASGYKSGSVTWSDNVVSSSGRMHIYSNAGSGTSELIYLDHNVGGAVIGTESGGSGNLWVHGSLTVNGYVNMMKWYTRPWFQYKFTGTSIKGMVGTLAGYTGWSFTAGTSGCLHIPFGLQAYVHDGSGTDNYSIRWGVNNEYKGNFTYNSGPRKVWTKIYGDNETLFSGLSPGVRYDIYVCIIKDGTSADDDISIGPCQTDTVDVASNTVLTLSY